MTSTEFTDVHAEEIRRQMPTMVTSAPSIVSGAPRAAFAPEMIAPVPVANDRNRSVRRRSGIVGRREQPPAIGADAERLKKIAGHELTIHHLVEAAVTDDRFPAAGGVSERAVELVDLVANLNVSRVAELRMVRSRGGRHQQQPTGFGHRQFAQHERVDQREDCSVRADTEGQRQDGGAGDDGRRGERTNRESDILHARPEAPFNQNLWLYPKDKG